MIKETSGSGIKNEIISNKELAEELHKPSLETFRKEKYTHAAQKMKLPVKDFFSQWDPIHRKQWIWSHLLKKSLMENFSFCAVSTFINTIWDADLADMQLITKFNNGIRFLLCVIDIYSKYTWIIPFLKKTIRITNSFQNVLDKSETK